MMIVRATLVGALCLLPMAGSAGAQSPDPVSPPACASRTDVLGISRIVEIDTAAGPRFGHQYKEPDFLEDGEVVLTFDDGPLRRYTLPILEALDAHCTKATFFAVGRMAIADPETLKDVARRGHTIGSHTWSHLKLKLTTAANATNEIELGLSAVSVALGTPPAPLFRFPYLADTTGTLAYLAERGMGVVGLDIDSRDFRTRNPGTVLRTTLAALEAQRKGIILFHDIQPSTAGAVASLLSELKARGYKVVHMVAKSPATTLPQYDAVAEKALKARLVAAQSNPLATRVVTGPAAGQDAEGLPWLDGVPSASAAPVQRSTTRRPRRPATANSPEDRWQLKSFGN